MFCLFSQGLVRIIAMKQTKSITEWRIMSCCQINSIYFCNSDTKIVQTERNKACFNPNRSLEKASCHFLMTAIKKTALYMLDS